jgi:hypothetical protein
MPPIATIARNVIWKLASNRAAGDHIKTPRAAAPRAFKTLRSRDSRRASRKTAVIKSARCTGAPKPVSKAYPKVSAMVTDVASHSLSFNLRPSQNTRPASRPTCIPETTNR